MPFEMGRGIQVASFFKRQKTRQKIHLEEGAISRIDRQDILVGILGAVDFAPGQVSARDGVPSFRGKEFIRGGRHVPGH